MTSACNWVNRVKRAAPTILGFNGKLGPIQSDGAFITDRVESRDTSRVLPITGHRMHNHFYIAEYERATYIWDENGASKRIPRSA
jgi:hypothetical protein